MIILKIRRASKETWARFRWAQLILLFNFSKLHEYKLYIYLVLFKYLFQRQAQGGLIIFSAIYLKGRGCDQIGIILHELMHALGFWHEQSRPDRGQVLKINWENILPGFEDNFAQHNYIQDFFQDMPYDTNSIMHYGPKVKHNIFNII